MDFHWRKYSNIDKWLKHWGSSVFSVQLRFLCWAAYHLRSRLGALGDCGRTNMSDTCCTWHVWWSMLYIYIYSQTNSRTLAYKPNVAIIDFQNYIICFVDVFFDFPCELTVCRKLFQPSHGRYCRQKNSACHVNSWNLDIDFVSWNEDEPLLRENWGFSHQQ